MTQATMTSETERLRRLAMAADCIPCEDETFVDWSRRKRVVAIGRSINGEAFKVTAPVQRPVQPPADWPTEDEIDMIIGKNYGYA